MDNKYQLRNGNMTTLLSGADTNGKFEFEGLMIDSIPNVVFKKYIWSHDVQIADGVKYVEIGTYIFDKLKESADQQLKEYIENNINDTVFYTNMNQNDSCFLTNNHSWEDEYPKIQRNVSTSYSEAGEGIFKITIDGIICVYDFKEAKFIKFEKEYNNSYDKDKKEITPLDIFYRRNLNLILAIEQYRKGTAHNVFTELVNLNKFLNGKKSVKINFKNDIGKKGKIVTLKSNNSVSSNGLFTIFNNEFYINDSYNMQPRLDKRLPLSELDYLQFGKKTYKINVENLVIK
ncbi:hypothetical protein [Clostridium tagluense]|uniref:Uncharacterized protein n=1 Tax=Clostridium tagluense TaxID=360422 RepID=A0A401USV6_9CLOT|nr:hypothetical protein [Clostridium tagluense]GCD12633.1 hypothetical protein Ctaglu_42560 [Clostridium tagluense]